MLARVAALTAEVSRVTREFERVVAGLDSALRERHEWDHELDVRVAQLQRNLAVITSSAAHLIQAGLLLRDVAVRHETVVETSRDVLEAGVQASRDIQNLTAAQQALDETLEGISGHLGHLEAESVPLDTTGKRPLVRAWWRWSHTWRRHGPVLLSVAALTSALNYVAFRAATRDLARAPAVRAQTVNPTGQTTPGALWSSRGCSFAVARNWSVCRRPASRAR